MIQEPDGVGGRQACVGDVCITCSDMAVEVRVDVGVQVCVGVTVGRGVGVFVAGRTGLNPSQIMSRQQPPAVIPAIAKTQRVSQTLPEAIPHPPYSS